MIEEVTKVRKLRVSSGRTLQVRFAKDRREYELDLTGLIARSRHFAPLIGDTETFAKAAIIEGGLGVAWPVPTKWGPLDVSATTLRRIAEEQQPMTGADFAKWRKSLGLFSRKRPISSVSVDELSWVISRKTSCRPWLRLRAARSPATNIFWLHITFRHEPFAQLLEPKFYVQLP